MGSNNNDLVSEYQQSKPPLPIKAKWTRKKGILK